MATHRIYSKSVHSPFKVHHSIYPNTLTSHLTVNHFSSLQYALDHFPGASHHLMASFAFRFHLFALHLLVIALMAIFPFLQRPQAIALQVFEIDVERGDHKVLIPPTDIPKHIAFTDIPVLHQIEYLLIVHFPESVESVESIVKSKTVSTSSEYQRDEYEICIGNDDDINDSEMST